MNLRRSGKLRAFCWEKRREGSCELRNACDERNEAKEGGFCFLPSTDFCGTKKSTKLAANLGMATRNGVTHLGVTPPISVLPPTSRDLEVSRTLIAELEARCVYENVEEGRNREIVLGRLNTLVKQFVYRSALAHGLPDAKAREA